MAGAILFIEEYCSLRMLQEFLSKQLGMSLRIQVEMSQDGTAIFLVSCCRKPSNNLSATGADSSLAKAINIALNDFYNIRSESISRLTVVR